MRDRTITLATLLVALVSAAILSRLMQRVISPPPALAPGASPATSPPHVDGQDVINSESMPESVPGNGTHNAPVGYPIKGNGRSGIFHVPGGFAYDRTVATVHFRTEAAAERAGFRHAKA